MSSNNNINNITPVPIWIDCDPGHDDAFALLLAGYSEEINILGVSIVHGNDSVEHCGKNASRFLWACGIKDIPIFIGMDRPLVREGKYCPEIHGTPGHAGVSGMCGYHFPDDIIFSNPNYQLKEGNGILKMVETIIEHKICKVTIVATGAHTNIAMAIRLFPQIMNNIEKIVFMGGAIGIGNTGVGAEFNIEIDPEATYIVLHSGLPIVMVPLEVTHNVLVTDEILQQIRTIGTLNLPANISSNEKLILASSTSNEIPNHPHIEYENIFKRLDDVSNDNNEFGFDSSDNIDNSASHSIPTTPFSECCFQLLTFFKTTYKQIFSFNYPSLHDPCAIFYIIQPNSFHTLPMFVDVELSSSKCLGRTLCDIHGILKQKANVNVCTKMNIDAFWNRMLQCIKIANEKSPL